MNFLFKLSYVNWNFALTLGYLNPPLNNPALSCKLSLPSFQKVKSNHFFLNLLTSSFSSLICRACNFLSRWPCMYTKKHKGIVSWKTDQLNIEHLRTTTNMLSVLYITTIWWSKLKLILGPFYVGKSCHRKEGHPPSSVTFGERLCKKKRKPLLPEPTAHVNALIFLPWLSWPGCASQRLYMEKSWPSWEVDPTPSRVTLLHESKSHFWQSQLFVLHVNGLPSFKRNVGRLRSPRVAWVVY